MELKTYFAQDAAGNIISSAIVNVFLQGTTTLATGLTRADGTPLENPFAADGAGRIQFRAPDGYYDIQVSAGSGIIQTLTIQCVDYSGAKADADRAEAAADRADVSAEQAQNALNSITGINTNFEQNSREQWRRSLAEAGLTLVSGSFEEGATANSSTDAVWHIAVGQCYTWDGAFPKAVAAGSTPATTGGVGVGAWVSVGDASLRNDLSSSRYQFVAGSENLPVAPEKLVYGPGKVTVNGELFESFLPGLSIIHSSVYMTPEDAIYGAGLGFPTDGNGNFNFVMSTGAHPEIAAGFNRSTAYGTNNFTKPIQIDRCEAIGNSALMFMRYGERNTMLGSIAGQWLGTNDPAGDGHEMWSNAGGFTPGQAGWDYGGFETANPGIGAKIAASTDYATQSDQCARNVGIGRNAFNGSVKLMNCTATGYRALASAYFASNSSAFGTDAFRSGLFLNNSVGIGFAAGTNWQEGERNVVVGPQAGVSVVKGDNNTLVGAFAGSDAKHLNDCIFIGSGGGNDVIASMPLPANILSIGNDVPNVGAPLICGDMANPKAGVNILPGKIAGTWHIRSSDAAASVIAPSGAADDFIIENGGNTGMTIRSAATSLGVINFSSPTVAATGGIIYNHSTSEMTLRSASADRWKINSAALNPATDNSSSVGTAALRASVIYAASGSINTSDGRLKDDVVEITAAEKRVAIKLKSLIRRFKYSESVAEKGSEARLHFGVVAQDVKAAFETEGLVAEDYGLLCHDEWDDVFEPVIATRTVTKTVMGSRRDYITGALLPEEEIEIETEEEYDTGEKRLVMAAGDRYGIRYEELVCFIIAAM